MYGYILFALALSVAETADVEPCCQPEEWEGKLTTVGSLSFGSGSTTYHQLTERSGSTSYSAKLGRVLSTYDPVNGFIGSTSLIDYRNGRTYYVYDYSGTPYASIFPPICFSSDLYIPYISCIDVNSTLVQTSTFGPPGSTVLVDEWRAPTISGIVNTDIVTRDGCLPVSKSYTADYGFYRMEQTTNIYDVRTSFADPTIFNVPDLCKKPPPKCCMPSVYSATVSLVGSNFNTTSKKNTIVERTAKLYVNMNQEKHIYKIFADDTFSSFGWTYIEDFARGDLYEIDPNNVCRIMPSEQKAVTCIPDDAKYLGERYFGGYYQRLKIQTWEYTVNNMRIRKSVSAIGCTPIFETTFDKHDDVDRIEEMNFVDIVPDETDVLEYTIPVGCTRIKPKNNDPEKCCPPELWEGNLRDLGTHDNDNSSHFNIIEERGTFHADSRQKKYAIQFSYGARVVQDFNLGKEYQVYQGRCHVKDLFRPFQHCIRDDSIYLGSSMVGEPGNGQTVDTWSTTVYGTEYITTVSRDGCYPLQFTFIGSFGDNSGRRTEETVYFTGIKEGVTNTSVFDIPNNCYDPPPKCCYPDQFKATLVNVGDSYNVYSNVNFLQNQLGNLYVDGQTNTSVIQLRGIFGTSQDLFIIHDFGARMNYITTNGVCVSSPSVETQVKCIPDDSTFLGTTYFGGPSSQLQFNTWEYNHFGSTFRVSVQTDNCFPLVQMVRSTVGNVTQENVFYLSDIEPTLTVNDTALFTVPTVCPLATTITAG